MDPKIGPKLQKTLLSGYIGQGTKVQEFETLLSEVFGWSNVLTLNSCTSALQLALHLVKEQDCEPVLLSPLSCFATVAAVLANKLRPCWVDINPETLNMDLNQLEQKLSADTRIIVLIHFAGRTFDYEHLEVILNTFQKKHHFRPYVIEDCAQSLGSVTNAGGIISPYTGNTGHISCFSFQAVKTLTTGDGGAIVIPDVELYERAKLLRWYGLDRTYSIKYQNIQEAGFKWHMNDINATIGIANLNFLDLNKLMLDQTTNYDMLLEAFDIPEPGIPCCGQFPLVVKDLHSFQKKMTKAGFECFPAQFRCDKHSCVASYQTHLPNMDLVEKHITLIPSGWWVGLDEIVEIIKLSHKSSKVDWKKQGF